MKTEKPPRRLHRKKTVTLAQVHDRKAQEIPMNAKIAVMEVDDPYSTGGSTERISVVRSIRDDPLGHMHARRQIDDAQYSAGRHWQRLHERANVGGVQSVDTTKEPVDGGRFPDLLSDGQRKALDGLRSAKQALGTFGLQIIEDVLARRMFIYQIAATYEGTDEKGKVTERQISNWSFVFRKYLEVLAVEFGYATPQQGRKNESKSKNKIVSWRAA